MLNVNTEAPDFTLCDENGVKHTYDSINGIIMTLIFTIFLIYLGGII